MTRRARTAYVPDPRYARSSDIQDACLPLVTVQNEGKHHRWKGNVCVECGTTPDRAQPWCSNQSMRTLFMVRARRGIVVPTAIVNIERLEKLNRRDLVTEARHLALATEGLSDQELRRSIYIARAQGRHRP